MIECEIWKAEGGDSEKAETKLKAKYGAIS
jgi:hypothetical protein